MLLGRLSVAGAGLLAATMDGLAADTLRAIPQSPDGVSLAPKVTPADARVDWSASAMRVDRLVRACTPAPGAWTTFRGRRLKLGPVVPIATDDGSPSVSPESPLPPGELAQRAGALPGVLAGTGTTAVLLGTVQPEGKAAMPAVDWARGARLTTEDRFV
jgi:methionyl-tRNA formyltransferase